MEGWVCGGGWRSFLPAPRVTLVDGEAEDPCAAASSRRPTVGETPVTTHFVHCARGGRRHRRQPERQRWSGTMSRGSQTPATEGDVGDGAEGLCGGSWGGSGDGGWSPRVCTAPALHALPSPPR